MLINLQARLHKYTSAAGRQALASMLSFGVSRFSPPVRQHALYVRFRKHIGESGWLREIRHGLLHGRNTKLHPQPSFYTHGTGILGASAALFTLAASVILVSPLKFSWLFLAPQGLVAIIYFVYNVVVVAEKSRIPGYDPQVAYVAHIVGFVIGIPFGIALVIVGKGIF